MTTEYDEDGDPITNPNNKIFENEVTFTSSITDTSTGLQYMNARYYDSSTGRFITQDTYSGNAYEPWTQHLYSYCGNYPVNFIDPTGHYWIDVNYPPYRIWATYGGDGSREGRKKFYLDYGIISNEKELKNMNDEKWRYIPQKTDAIVFYNPEQFGAQAKDEAVKLGEEYDNVVKVSIDCADEFVETWNNLPYGVDEISLIYHGGPHAMGVGHGNNINEHNEK